MIICQVIQKNLFSTFCKRYFRLKYGLVQMTGHLNRFACQAESKLAEVDRRTQQIQTTLLLLEAKLASIPELESVKLEEEPPKSDVTTQNQSEPAQSAPVVGSENAEQSTEIPPEEPAPEAAPGP